MTFRSSFVGCFMLATIASVVAADPRHGKDIADRWCASCHLVDSGRRTATDEAPPFAQIAKAPDFDQNKLAFLLLSPHPNHAKLIPQMG
jgi:hypothetical protein